MSEISQALKKEVENRFDHVRVRGELSGFKRAASGHCYMGLKDDRSVIDGVIWKGQAARLGFVPEDGLEVIATGKLTTYPGRSKYQIVIEHLEVAGEGALMQLLEQRRKGLAAEGLFAEERKKPLPFLPKTIGVVTSPTGAVIRDILHRLADRLPSHVVLWPVIVQGEGAAEQVARAIAGFDAIDAKPDILIVARGGGSIEDLWAFNEEAVVRAIASCSIPVISAVGHETDTSLSDWAADVRAPTPTAAAEMAVPVRADLLAGLAQSGLRATNAVRRQLERGNDRLALFARQLPRRDALYAPQRQKVDDYSERMRQAFSAVHRHRRDAYSRYAERLQPLLLHRRMDRGQQAVASLGRLLSQLHPEAPLKKGYARISDRDDRTLISAGAAREAAALRLHFADGKLDARVEDGDAPPYARKKPKSKTKPRPPGQPGLFD